MRTLRKVAEKPSAFDLISIIGRKIVLNSETSEVIEHNGSIKNQKCTFQFQHWANHY